MARASTTAVHPEPSWLDSRQSHHLSNSSPSSSFAADEGMEVVEVMEMEVMEMEVMEVEIMEEVQVTDGVVFSALCQGGCVHEILMISLRASELMPTVCAGQPANAAE